MSLLVSGYAVRLYEAFCPVYLSLAVITASTKSYPESLFIAILPVLSTLTSASELSYIMLLSFFLLANIFLNTENHCGMKIKNIFFLFKK